MPRRNRTASPQPHRLTATAPPNPPCSTTVFSHSQTVVLCGSCSTVLCTPTGGKARLTEGARAAAERKQCATAVGT